MLKTDKLPIWKWFRYRKDLQEFLLDLKEHRKKRNRISNDLRFSINRRLKKIRKLVHAAGFPTNLTNIGDVFDHAFHFWSFHGSVNHNRIQDSLIDLTERTLGWHEEKFIQSILNTINPIYWAWRIDRKIYRILSDFLQHSLFIEEKPSNIMSTVLTKIAELTAIVSFCSNFFN